MCAYRVVQETLTNCARHAGAKKAQVQLKDTATQLELSVSDDGRGFDTTAPRHGGLGLIGIEERVRELGGELQIVSEPGKGSHLTVRFPLAQGIQV